MLDPMISTVFIAASLIAAVGFVWRSRLRARRRRAALDAYAEREIARAATR